jgi:hypothetical protein
MDANGNGVIDKDEFRGPPDMFGKMDADNSGTLTKEELDAAREKMMQHAAAMRGEHKGGKSEP